MAESPQFPLGDMPPTSSDAINAPTIKLAQATKEAKAPIGAMPPAASDAVNAPTIKVAQATKEAKAPMGAVPPPKKETGKVQPKKETVRINLPPKPTAAPTIKLPTLPPGGSTGAPSPVSAAVSAPATPSPALRTAAAPAAHAAKAGAAPIATPKPASAAQRAATPSVPTIKPLDKILIYAATVASLVAVGYSFYVFFFVLKPLVENFQS